MYKNNYIQGQKLGNLIFINRVASTDKGCHPLANFKCECGKEFVCRIDSAKIGKTKSCGCLQPKVASILKNVYNEGDKIGDDLIYLRDAEYKKGWSRNAIFLCVCGTEFKTAISRVKAKETKSCGCLTKELLSQKGNNEILKMPTLSENDINRFWNKVAITANDNICWNWQYGGERYGNFSIKGNSYKSSRVAYFLAYNIDPSELCVLHSCDNPKCCNPKHLSLGTHYENMQDMKEKGRAFNGKVLNDIKQYKSY